MNKHLKTIFIISIMLTGVYCFGGVWEEYTAKFGFRNENSGLYVAKMAIFWLVSGCFGAFLIYKHNKLVGLLALASAIGLFKTYLCDHAPKDYMYASAVLGYSAFMVYYFVRETKIKEEWLKYLMIPAVLNICLIFCQVFDKSTVFTGINEVTGFVGNKGMTAAYLALICPVFLKYWKPGFILSLIAMVLCSGAFGLVASVVSGLFYLFYMNKKQFFILLVLFIVSVGIVFGYKPLRIRTITDLQLRASMAVGTLHGIMRNPVLGWGVGSFIPVVSKIPPGESEYCGRRFNTGNFIMNHPHNELLAGWWRIGVAFPVLCIMIFLDYCKKFKKERILSFSILVSASVISMGWFFTPAALFVLLITMGVYENGD